MSAIDRIAAAVSDASWGSLGGGQMVFGRADGSGGAWYSSCSRPRLAADEIVVRVPSRSVSREEAAEIVRELLAEEDEDDAR